MHKMLRYSVFAYLLLSLLVVFHVYGQNPAPVHTADLVLREAISIQGTLMMLDNATPHVAVPVQAVHNGEVMATALSNEGGRYKLINLKPGRYQVRCQVLGGYVYYGRDGSGRRWEHEKVEGTDASFLGDFLQFEPDRTLQDTDFCFAPFKKGTWRNYNYLDGLSGNQVLSIHHDPDGTMWFATRGGVSRFDGKGFLSLTTEDGLTDNRVTAIHCDPDGTLWFGTGGGVSRYDGKEFANFTTEDGLAHNEVYAVYGDSDGVMWFGTGGGVSRYDGKEFVSFTTEDGLAHNRVSAIHCDLDGVMWFGTGAGGTEAGVSRYDGNTFINFTAVDGQRPDMVGRERSCERLYPGSSRHEALLFLWKPRPVSELGPGCGYRRLGTRCRCAKRNRSEDKHIYQWSA